MITIGICDDDAMIREQLSYIVEEKFSEMLVYTFSAPDELEDFLQNKKNSILDILIMDIVFEKQNGIQVAKKIQNLYPKMQLIYLTGYIDYARDIFETNPIYFLVKPIEENKLSDALSRAILKCKEKELRYMTIQMKSGVYKIYYDEIIYVESEKRDLHIHLRDEVITYIAQLATLEKEFPKEYVRIHQSFLVNMDYISAFEKNEVRLKNGQSLPVSRHRCTVAKEKFLKYIGELL